VQFEKKTIKFNQNYENELPNWEIRVLKNKKFFVQWKIQILNIFGCKRILA